MRLLGGVDRAGELAGRAGVLGLQLRLSRGGSLLHGGERGGGIRGCLRRSLARLAELLEVRRLAQLLLLLVFVIALLELALHDLGPLRGDLLLLALDLVCKVILEHVERLILVAHHLRPERVHLRLRPRRRSLGVRAELLDAGDRLRGASLQFGDLRSELKGRRLRLGSLRLKRGRVALLGEGERAELRLDVRELPAEGFVERGGFGGGRLRVRRGFLLLGEEILRPGRRRFGSFGGGDSLLEVRLALRQGRLELLMLLVPDLRALLLELVDAELQLSLLLLDPAKVLLEELILRLHATLLRFELRVLLRGGHGGALAVRGVDRRLRRELVGHGRRGSLRLRNSRLHLGDELRLEVLARVDELILLGVHHLERLLGRLDMVGELLEVRLAVGLLGLGPEGDDALDAGEKGGVVEDHLGEFLDAASLARRVRGRGEALIEAALLAEVLGRHGLALQPVQPAR